MKARFLIGAVLLAACVASAQESETAQPAKPRSVDELLKDRATVKDALTKLTKSFESSRDEFMQRPETKDFNAKQQKLQEVFQATDKRLKDLDSQIAERVAGEKKETK